MALLNEEIVQNVKDMLSDMSGPVTLAVFTDDQHCEYCREIVQLVNEVADTSEKLSVEQHEIHRDAQRASELKIERAPVIAILGERDYGLRFFGIPSGYEFSTLLHAVLRASHGRSELDDPTKSYLASLNTPVDYQVFVTPTCPYCPRSAVLAMDMAVESPLVNANVVESAEFPELANSFSVMGVPLTVINGRERVEGAAPSHMVVDAIRRAVA